MHKFSREESLTIDYAKAIGIFFVVLGHYDASVMNLFKPYTFHMPLFFLIGGITLNYHKPLVDFTITSLKSLIIYAAATYIITGAASEMLSDKYNITSLGNAFISDPLTTFNTALKYNFANNRLFVVAWFLLCYFLSSLLCLIICKLIKKSRIEGSEVIIFCAAILLGIFAIDFLSIGQMNQAKNVMIQTLVASMFFMIGCALRGHLHIFSSPFIGLSACVMVYLLRGNGMTSDFIMSISKYPYGSVITITQSLCGIYLVMFFSKLISVSDYRWIIFIGRRTKTIMSYHVIVFILLDIAFYKAGMYDISKSDAFIHFKSWYTVPLYVALSMLIPALFNLLYINAKNYVIFRSRLYRMST